MIKLTDKHKETLDKANVFGDKGVRAVWWFDVVYKDGKREGKWVLGVEDNSNQVAYDSVSSMDDVVDVLPALHPFPHVRKPKHNSVDKQE